MSSLYSITLHDVLTEWWNENKDEYDSYVMSPKVSGSALIACKTCDVTWLRVYQDSKFEYALEPNGDQYYLDPGDPDLFEKFSVILNAVTHDPEYRCEY